MNSDNNTIVSGELLEELRKKGLAKGYTKVPGSLEEEARRILGGADIADIPEATKNHFTAQAELEKRERYLEKKEREAEGNRRHEAAMREARERIASGSLNEK